MRSITGPRLHQRLEVVKGGLVVSLEAGQPGGGEMTDFGLRIAKQDVFAQRFGLGELPQRQIGVDQTGPRRGTVADALKDRPEVFRRAAARRGLGL